VLAGGELGALIVIETVSRLIDGVLGNSESVIDETNILENKKEYPQYTRPLEFNNLKVPEILLSGDHAKIKKWRENLSKITQ
jgi:tRNA (guanine37-N1)-methyltransferase